MHDLRDAWRALRRTPLVTAVAILSLALGIGANTAMFSIVDALILRSLPVPHAARLALITQNGVQSSLTNPIWEEIRERPTLFDGAFAWGGTRFNLASGGEAEYINGIFASGAMFDVLGVSAIVGRTFTTADDRRGEGLVAVISHAYWQRRYGGARDVIGQAITLNQVPFTIIGITPKSFLGPEVGSGFDVAVPLGSEAAVYGAESSLDRRSYWWLNLMARLRPGQSLAEANAALRTVQPQMREATMPPHYRPESRDQYLKEPFTLVAATRGTSELRDEYSRPLLTIMAVVALVLLIACGNIANLLLARAASRRHELSVRQALGASRWHLARQLLAESAVLSSFGAVLGCLVAVVGSRLLVRQLSTGSTQVALDLSVDWRLFAFTALVAIATALLFGTLPALRASRARPMEAMREQGRGNTADGRVGLGGGLVIAQVALSLMLVVGAGMFVRTFATLSRLQLGFDHDRLLLVNIGAQRSAVDSSGRLALYERVRQAALAIPGVTQAALSTVTPVSGSTWNTSVTIDGAPPPPSGEHLISNVNFLSAGWFATYGTPLLAGRDFDDRDRRGAPQTVIVNETFVRRFLGGASPLGRTVREPGEAGQPDQVYEIVGLAADAVYGSLRDSVPPTMYQSLPQQRRVMSFVGLAVRASAGEPGLLARSVVDAVTRVDPGLVLTVRTMATQVANSLQQERLVALLSGFFGALALLLAGLGLYGVTAYSVTRRRAELGIRMALGSAPAGVLRLVMARVGVLVASGILVGGLGTWYTARFVDALLFGMGPGDPTSLVAGAAVLGGVGLLAGWVPARRAARIDPAVVLREE